MRRRIQRAGPYAPAPATPAPPMWRYQWARLQALHPSLSTAAPAALPLAQLPAEQLTAVVERALLAAPLDKALPRA